MQKDVLADMQNDERWSKLPKVSIVIPVYNVEPYIRQCLESVLNQTLHDIEIICVDDFSTDGSREILRHYAQQDSRVVPIFHEQNLGTSQTRKDGVLASCGKYVIFCDGDDTLELNACAAAFTAIESSHTDIVQFGVNIVNRCGASSGRIESNQKMVEPYVKKIRRDNLIHACWTEELFGFSLWNKIYKGEICRTAFSHIEDGWFPKAQDLYAFFLIAFFAKSSFGITHKLYNYNFGIGVTGGEILDINRFGILLTEKKVHSALVRFVTAQNEFDKYKGVLDKIYRRFLLECINKWYRTLQPESTGLGFEKMVEVWGYRDVLCTLAEQKWYDRSNLAEKLADATFFSYKKRSKRQLTIAAYYRSISNGGAQRVVAMLCNIWARQKDETGQPLYRVVLITDGEKKNNEYPLDGEVCRAYLPAQEISRKEQYSTRFDSWEQILSTYSIDIVVSSMWVDPCTFWDMLSVKGFGTKPAFIIHSHSFCCLPYRFTGGTAWEVTRNYRFCDGVVVLSECDRRFASAFSQHVRYICNPITFSPKTEELAKREKNAIVWVARISEEKRPLDAVEMMSYVVKEIPDAKLYIVGGGNEGLSTRLREKIEALQLEKNVELVGFTLDVEKYYQKANLYVCTSEYEGFSLTFSEAMSHGLPIVSYDMPWLTFVRDGRGVIAVEQKRIDRMAKEVVCLLRKPAQAREIGQAGKEQITEMAQIDLGAEWKQFFDGIGNFQNEEANEPLPVDDVTIFTYLSKYQQIAKDNIRNTLQKEINALNSSWSYRIGRVITFVPRKIRGGIRCYQENGLRYTIRRLGQKLKLVN